MLLPRSEACKEPSHSYCLSRVEAVLQSILISFRGAWRRSPVHPTPSVWPASAEPDHACSWNPAVEEALPTHIRMVRLGENVAWKELLAQRGLGL